MGDSAAVRKAPSLRWRLAAAIALTVGFYTLALLMAAALLAVAILPWVLRGSNNLWVTVTCFVLGVTILVAIFPRRQKIDPHGVRLTAADQPRLMAMIDEEARATGAGAPDEVYATLEANASVMQARGRRIMFLGVPLLHILSERGMRGVIAHEFGHYAGGDTRLGPWVWRTYDGVARTVDYLTDDDGDEGWTQKAVRQPFIWYGRAFMRITAAIKRRQEFAADRMAADSAGRDTYVEALRRIHAYAPAFDAYWENEVAAVLGAGRRPPVVAGFGTYLRSDVIDRAAGEMLEQQLKETTDRYDSHPSLSERIEALHACPPGDTDGSSPALSVLRDPERLERELLASLVHPEAADLPELAWDDVGREIYLARARALRDAHGEILGEAKVADLGDRARALGPIAGQLQQREPELPPEAAGDFAATLLAEATLVALADAGWTVDAGLAEPVTASRGDERLNPYEIVAKLREDAVAGAGWRERATTLGIAELKLNPAPADEAKPPSAASHAA
jgi:Zn-dependent protease with chaperone function